MDSARDLTSQLSTLTFDLLRWHSQHSNTKVRDLAARLAEAIAGGIGTPITATRMDRLLDVVTGNGRRPTHRAS